MVTGRLLLAVAGAVLPWWLQAAEVNLGFLAAPEYHGSNRDSPYYAGPPTVRSDHATSRQDLGLKVREGGFFAEGTLRWIAGEGGAHESHGIANQLYYDGAVTPGVNWSIGRKVLSWGVGFALRPLDVVQREDRRAVNPAALVGIPLIAMDHFTADQAWTVAWLNPGTGSDNTDRKDEALALRWYRFSGSDDFHAVARLSRQRRLEAGLGTTRVLGDDWSIYGAALYAERYGKVLNSLAEGGSTLFDLRDPRTRVYRHHGAKAVIGAQWTGVSGWSLLGEIFYDGDAYTRDDWRRLDDLTRRQSAAAAFVPPALLAANVAWSSQAYRSPSLLRQNLLLRLSYDDGDGFKPYLEMLLTPEDGGHVGTAGVSYARNRQRFSGGLRHVGGPGDSVYGRSPEKNIFWIEWQVSAF